MQISNAIVFIVSATMNILGCLAVLSSIYFCSGQSDGIYRPCRRTDRACIGRVFSQELRCPLRTQIRNTRPIRFMPLHYPPSNFSVTYSGASVTGLTDFTVQEFYINRRTRTLVLEVVFAYLDVEVPITTGFFYKKGKAPVITQGASYSLYYNYSLTLTVYNVDGRSPSDRDVSDYQVYTHITEGFVPEFGYEEKLKPKDPEALREWQSFFDNDDLSWREEAVEQSPLLMSFVLPCELQLTKWTAILNVN